MLREGNSEKAGIVTLYHGNYNFGGLLQAYALPAALACFLNISAEQIDYIVKWQERPAEKSTPSLKNLINTMGYRFFTRLETKNLQKRKQAFEAFIQWIPHSEESYESDSISKTLDRYTAFLCGGDQIWNDYRQIDWFSGEDSKVFTLQFVPDDEKKIAYAPSMAFLHLTDGFKTDFCQAVNRLDAISVREKSAVPVLQELTDKPIAVTVDPVLLLEETDWRKVMRYPSVGRRYILCYLLADSIAQRVAVKKLARKLHLPIVTFPHILGNDVRKSDLFFGDIRDYTSGPREFLGLIKNAEFVITDSFHACVFSMIFRTPFAVFERDKANRKGNMNSRIYDFLEEYHLEHQLVTEETLAGMNEIPKVDFSYAHQHWKRRREESLEYLRNALKGSENGAEG